MIMEESQMLKSTNLTPCKQRFLPPGQQNGQDVSIIRKVPIKANCKVGCIVSSRLDWVSEFPDDFSRSKLCYKFDLTHKRKYYLLEWSWQASN